jgi:hypoxanthine-DNA glycosylase
MKDNICRSFRPVIDHRSRVLVLGSMPGPVALRKREYYGFNGNHFWTIMPALLGEQKTEVYEEKLAMVRKHRVALWDVLKSCTRPTAMDSDIRNIVPNKIPELLKGYPHIRAVFVNGQFGYKTFQKHFGPDIGIPVHPLPSSSPANAAMPLSEKISRWRVILKFL